MKTNKEIAEILLEKRKKFLSQHDWKPSMNRLEELSFEIGVMYVLENLKEILAMKYEGL